MARLGLVVCSALLLLAGSVEARRKPHHPRFSEARAHHHHDAEDDLPTRHHVAVQHKDAKVEGEAADLRAMMEGVKAKTGETPKREAPTDLAPKSQDDHVVDTDILAEAAKMKAMMSKNTKAKKHHSHSALATHTASTEKVDEKSQQDRAARYFATHDMGSVGKMLGETMNSADATKAAALMKQALKQDRAQEQEKRDFGDIDMDDDVDADQKARWAKVDALKRKSGFLGA